MSQYIQFFIRSTSDEFLPIGVFSRCTSIYHFFNEYLNAPYGRIAAVTMKDILYVVDKVKDRIEVYEDRVVELERKIKLITECNNSVEEKMEGIDEVNREINEYVEEKNELKWTRDYICSLEEILSAIAYDDKYCQDTYLYCGIECREHVTVEDIVVD